MTTYRLAEAAELLGVSDDTVRRWADAGRFATHARRRTAMPASRAPRWPRWPASSPHIPPDGAVAASHRVSARNHLRGIVTEVKRDTVMAQVEMCCGPYRVVSLMSREAADALEPGARCRRRRIDQGNQRRRGGPDMKLARSRSVRIAGIWAALLPRRTPDSRPAEATTSSDAHGVRRRLAHRVVHRRSRTTSRRTTPASTSSSPSIEHDLATQINEGSPADVLATADEKSMRSWRPTRANIDGDPTQFATNTLVVVTPPDNPANITCLDDLADADFVVCDPSVPCGAAAATFLDNAGITAQPKSLEEDVKAVLTKVDARRGRRRHRLRHRRTGGRRATCPRSTSRPTSTWSTRTSSAPSRTPASPTWPGVGRPRHVRGGQSVLTDAGFGPPP